MTRNLVCLTEPGRTLVCMLPFAGGSASSYWPWSSLLPTDVQVSAVHLPGRQDRWHETPYQDFGILVSDLADEIAEAAAGGPYVLVGHSLGATLAYEVARELRRRSAPDPVLLVISAAVAPQIDHDPIGAERLSDDELMEQTRQTGRLPAQITENTELLELVLPALRADLALVDSYRYLPGEPLSCPISVFGGRQDPQVPVTALDPWRALTSNRTTVRVFDGDHFYLWGREDEVAQAILGDLADLSTGVGL